MPESGQEELIIFAESLVRSVARLLGPQTVTAIFSRTFPRGELSLTIDGGVSASGPHSREHVRRLTEALADLFVASFGLAFAERSLAEAYARATRGTKGMSAAADILYCIPDGFLEKEKVKPLSKSELEERVLQRTAELQEANARLEERVAQRTQELISANAKLEDANQEFQRLSSAKSEFLSMVSHQLLVPLTAARWLAKTLEDDLSLGAPHQTRTLLDELLANNAHMVRLVANLLNVARIEEGRMEYKMETIALADFLKEITQALAPLAVEKGVTLRCAAENPCLVRGDRDKLRMAFENIMDNAIKYTPQGKLVMVTLDVGGTSVRVKVTDQGIGISEADHGQIFGKFFRAHNARTHQISGSGLGLFVAREILEAHKGRIWFESAEGEGTTFFMELSVSRG
ncbi:MAG: hypothetical protein A3C92_03805 [Candidatus Sungbacteria bacterium RIFCSPHIGHO2_02_FULL_53_17]|nr:MAG: hypothetical protein A3C92_03805 [Candidatus Sungbacteria bacterium RIFCSPHIGHO2_02_FULL_53_17]